MGGPGGLKPEQAQQDENRWGKHSIPPKSTGKDIIPQAAKEKILFQTADGKTHSKY